MLIRPGFTFLRAWARLKFGPFHGCEGKVQWLNDEDGQCICRLIGIWEHKNGMVDIRVQTGRNSKLSIS